MIAHVIIAEIRRHEEATVGSKKTKPKAFTTAEQKAATLEQEIKTAPIQKALDVIGFALAETETELCDGLPDGSESHWGYDEQLVRDIALAVHRWNQRVAAKGG